MAERNRKSAHKLALLYTMKYFLEETDENHSINAPDIIAYLERQEIHEDRRTVYESVKILRDFGLDIVDAENGGKGGWFMASRDFETAELKLLVDAVQASKFITVKKSGEMIGKLSKLTSVHLAKRLNREVIVRNRNKTQNEKILYNVDCIYEAIDADSEIEFTYGEYTPDKKLVARKNGKVYKVSPWALTWDDENYYLIAYDAEHGEIRHYRVDKMIKPRMIDESRLGKEKYKEFNVGEYMKMTFGMFGGEKTTVELLCENKLAGVIIDRFGKDVVILKNDENTFKSSVKVAVSPQFFGWVTSIGEGITITGPENVRENYIKYLKKIVKGYGK